MMQPPSPFRRSARSSMQDDDYDYDESATDSHSLSPDAPRNVDLLVAHERERDVAASLIDGGGTLLRPRLRGSSSRKENVGASRNTNESKSTKHAFVTFSDHSAQSHLSSSERSDTTVARLRMLFWRHFAATLRWTLWVMILRTVLGGTQLKLLEWTQRAATTTLDDNMGILGLLGLWVGSVGLTLLQFIQRAPGVILCAAWTVVSLAAVPPLSPQQQLQKRQLQQLREQQRQQKLLLKRQQQQQDQIKKRLRRSGTLTSNTTPPASPTTLETVDEHSAHGPPSLLNVMDEESSTETAFSHLPRLWAEWRLGRLRFLDAVVVSGVECLTTVLLLWLAESLLPTTLSKACLSYEDLAAAATTRDEKAKAAVHGGLYGMVMETVVVTLCTVSWLVLPTLLKLNGKAATWTLLWVAPLCHIPVVWTTVTAAAATSDNNTIQQRTGRGSILSLSWHLARVILGHATLVDRGHWTRLVSMVAGAGLAGEIMVHIFPDDPNDASQPY